MSRYDTVILGVYIIQCKINKKIYTGGSKTMYKRWKVHIKTLNDNAEGCNKYLQEDWNKYGEENFEFKIIEECNEDVLLEREIHYTKLYRSNEREFGYNDHCGNKNSEETKNKISKLKIGNKYNLGKKHSEETKLKIKHSNNGKIFSKESKEKMSISAKNKIVSNKTKEKMSLGHKGLKQSKETIEKRSGINNCWVIIDKIKSKDILEKLNKKIEVKDLAKEYNCSLTTIRNIKNNKHWTCK